MLKESILEIPNLKAFLSTISYSEGTDKYPNDGYNTSFTGKQFVEFKDHPRVILGTNLRSDAAGRYQIMSYTWDAVKKQFSPELPDFSPKSQDLAACQLLSNRNSLNDVCNGHFDTAIQKCCLEWASFPDANKNGASHYGGQPSHSLEVLRKAYLGFGGKLA